MNGFLNRLANNEKEGSLANRFRKKRFAIFQSLTNGLSKPIRIIDLGGTENYWEKMGFVNNNNFEITIVNLHKQESQYSNIKIHKGDARNLPQFNDQSFHISFSNSVIEHVGSYNDQVLMAREMQRLAPRFYLQTPNYYFPLEPHFLFPFFQFLPVTIRVWLLMRFQLGWYPKYSNRGDAENAAKSIRLLKYAELKKLFPGARIIRERFLGLTKSYVLIGGF